MFWAIVESSLRMAAGSGSLESPCRRYISPLECTGGCRVPGGRARGSGSHTTPESASKQVDVLVELVEQKNGLDDHVVHPVYVEL